MSVETKHTEKNALYQMLLVKNGKQSINQAMYALKAIMDPDDVELVEKQLMEMLKDEAND